MFESIRWMLNDPIVLMNRFDPDNEPMRVRLCDRISEEVGQIPAKQKMWLPTNLQRKWSRESFCLPLRLQVRIKENLNPYYNNFLFYNK